MSVDYRLLPHFTASRERLEAARSAIPPQWRDDARPSVQELGERWVEVRARARAHLELVHGAPPAGLPGDDR